MGGWQAPQAGLETKGDTETYSKLEDVCARRIVIPQSVPGRCVSTRVKNACAIWVKNKNYSTLRYILAYNSSLLLFQTTGSLMSSREMPQLL